MNVRQLLNHINTFAPFDLAEDWDNPGLMVGSYKDEVKRVGICLDAVSEAVAEAGIQGCNVLLTHHPLIFRGLKHIDIDSETGKTIHEAIKRGVTIIAAHTNWDKAEKGVNATLAALLGIGKIESLGEIGVHGKVIKCNLESFIRKVKSSWGLSRLDIYAESTPTKILRVAICGGSGAEFWHDALRVNADIYLTADMKYHELIDATRAGLAIGLADHGEMERASLPELENNIKAGGFETKLININALATPLRA